MKEEESITQSKNYLLLFFDLYPIFFFIVLNIGKLLIATVPTMEIRINVNLFGLTEARLNKIPVADLRSLDGKSEAVVSSLLGRSFER